MSVIFHDGNLSWLLWPLYFNVCRGILILRRNRNKNFHGFCRYSVAQNQGSKEWMLDWLMLLLSGCFPEWSRVAHFGPLSPSPLLTVIVVELVYHCTLLPSHSSRWRNGLAKSHTFKLELHTQCSFCATLPFSFQILSRIILLVWLASR